MIVRNDANRTQKAVQIGDIIYMSGMKYSVYSVTEKSIKINCMDEKMPAGLKRKDFINKNTFAKSFFFDKSKLIWQYLLIRKVVNLDYL